MEQGMKQENELPLFVVNRNDFINLNKSIKSDTFGKFTYVSYDDDRRCSDYYRYIITHKEVGVDFLEYDDNIELFRRYLHYALYVSKIENNDNIVTFDAMVYDNKDIFYNVLIYDKSNKIITYSDVFVQYIYDTICEMKNDDTIDLNKYDFIVKINTKEDVICLLNNYHKYTNYLCLYFIYRDIIIKTFNN